jgi:hypothetical protein
MSTRLAPTPITSVATSAPTQNNSWNPAEVFEVIVHHLVAGRHTDARLIQATWKLVKVLNPEPVTKLVSSRKGISTYNGFVVTKIEDLIGSELPSKPQVLLISFLHERVKELDAEKSAARWNKPQSSGIRMSLEDRAEVLLANARIATSRSDSDFEKMIVALKSVAQVKADYVRAIVEKFVLGNSLTESDGFEYWRELAYQIHPRIPPNRALLAAFVIVVLENE